MKGYIYMLTAPDGRRYIGQTTDFRRRMREYEFPSKANDSPVYREIHRQGFNAFKKEILDVIEGGRDEVRQALNVMEREYILLYGTVTTGLNVARSDGHNRLYVPSESVKEKIRKAQTGRKHSEASKAKRAGANAYQGKMVYSATLDKTFYTLREAAHYVGIKNGCKISECIKDIRKHAGTDPKTGIAIGDWEYVARQYRAKP